jgi:lipopolysaccharide transport system permease protein
MTRRIYEKTPLAAIRSTMANWYLIVQMTKREVVGRYRGSVMGLMWSFFNPVLMLTVYTIVFSTVFKIRWPQTTDNKFEFAILLFTGMIAHGLLSECITKAPGLILGNTQYVKRVVFPLEVLPWVSVFTALFHATVSFLVLLLFIVAVHGGLHITVLLAPIVLIPFVLLAIGISWLLAAVGVYIRDIAQVVNLLTMVLLFLSPIFYPVSALPKTFQVYAYINPLTLVIEQLRDTIVWGRLPNWHALGVYAIVCCSVAWIGFWWFQATRRGFADVV